WVRDSLEVRTFAGRAALTLGHLDEARVQLAQAAETRHSGSSALRASAWLAAATLQLADGDRAGARRSLSTGMEIVEDHRSTLGSTELRAHASINGAELAELGLRLATEDNDPDEVLAWAERWHAGGFQLAPAKPDPDSRLAKAMVELRQAHAAAIEGSADPFDSDDDDRVASLEHEIRTLSREVEASNNASNQLADVNALRTRLAGNTLVEFFTIEHILHAVTVVGEETSVQTIGPLEDVAAEVRKLVSALGRLAFGATNDAMTSATTRALEATAQSLDQKLLGHLPAVDEGALVIVPTGPLQSLAWAVLPSLTDRPVTVAPSGGLWASTPGFQRSGRQQALLVCGSNLPGGETEIERLRELYDEPQVLSGADATVSAVLAAMETADVVHVAAHGVFRTDNPMFSALELHDGPLTVYDLETLESAPETVILPACDAARSSVRHGDELLGTASALLQVGVRTIVAPVTVVPDSTVVPTLMVELHRRMIEGRPPGDALVEARRTIDAEEQGPGLTAASFLTIGTAST
ncbi:MAG: CHAT domain-containing protein, partial [Acidimicrobiales bacterium]